MTFINSNTATWNGQTFAADYFIVMPLTATDQEVARFRKEENLLNLGYCSKEHAELFAKTDRLSPSDIQV